MTLQAGTRLGPYEIVASIGAGGMGEVWRARDTRLDRDVAIKVLPPGLAENAEFLQRFEREAKAISRLNHPHVCTLHDVGEAASVHYLVMEYLEGESLAERIRKGPLPLPEVLKLGQQIASALGAAHRQGITHRDLKPGNIMLTRSGAKLLDFGLAKTSTEGKSPVEGLTNLPTEAKPLTEQGTILGTFQYMAPEQLEGIEADARTDIFALGAVLYEMATGRRAFQGQSRTSLIAAIVSSQPEPISSVVAMSPPALDHVVRRCLEKDREDRWQSALDLASELRWISEAGSQAGVATKVASSRRRREQGMMAAIAVLVALVAGLGWLAIQGQRAATERPVALRIDLPDGWDANFRPVVSPDGSKIAFAATTRTERALWLRSLDSEELKRIPGTDGFGNRFFWSPAGDELAVSANHELKRVPLDGRSPVTICKCSISDGAWSPSGTLVLSTGWGKGLSRVDVSGGDPVPLTRLDASKHESVHKSPYFLADGTHFAFLGRTALGVNSEIYLASLDDPTPRRILTADDLNGVLPGNTLLFVRGGRLLTQRIDISSAKPVGDEVEVADRVHYSGDAASGFAGGAARTIAWRSPILRRGTLRWRARDGSLLAETGFSGPYDQVRLSPDGTRAVTDKSSDKGVGDDIWVLEFARKLETRLSTHPENDQGGQWSRDGRTIVFSSGRRGLYDLFEVNSDGGKEPTLLLGDELRFDKHAGPFAPDGQSLLFAAEESGTARNVYRLDLATRAAVPLLHTEAFEAPSAFSPDGEWFAYVSDQSGRVEVYIQRLDGKGRRVQISTNGGGLTRWVGDEIFYFAGQALWSVRVRLSGETATAERPVKLRDTIEGVMSWDTVDGKRFLTLENADADPAPDPIHVLLNGTISGPKHP